MLTALKGFLRSSTGILVLIIVLLLGYLTYLNHKIGKQTESVLQVQLSSNQALESKFNELKLAQRDTLIIIQNNITKEEKIKEEAQHEVSNTNNIDSVIANYFHYRPSHSN